MKNVFTTEQEWIEAKQVDFEMYKASKSQEVEEYWEQTKAYDEGGKRYDAEEWYCEVCPEGIQTHEQKEEQDSWYAPRDEYTDINDIK